MLKNRKKEKVQKSIVVHFVLLTILFLKALFWKLAAHCVVILKAPLGSALVPTSGLTAGFDCAGWKVCIVESGSSVKDLTDCLFSSSRSKQRRDASRTSQQTDTWVMQSWRVQICLHSVWRKCETRRSPSASQMFVWRHRWKIKSPWRWCALSTDSLADSCCAVTMLPVDSVSSLWLVAAIGERGWDLRYNPSCAQVKWTPS